MPERIDTFNEFGVARKGDAVLILRNPALEPLSSFQALRLAAHLVVMAGLNRSLHDRDVEFAAIVRSIENT